MKRRDSIRQIVLGSAGMMLAPVLPGWANAWTRETLPPSASFLTPSETEVLVKLADTIIPAGDAIGALSVGVDQYLVSVLEKCYPQETHDTVRTHLSVVEQKAQQNFQTAFAACNQQQRLRILQDMAASTEESERNFVTLIKSETVRGFTTSREVMVDYYRYQVAPGHYSGCVDVTP